MVFKEQKKAVKNSAKLNINCKYLKSVKKSKILILFF